MTNRCLPVRPVSSRAAESRAASANWLLLFGVATLTACANLSPAGTDDRGVAAPYGSLAVSGPTFGKQAMLPTVCVSGERELFLGFDLRDAKSELVTRLVVDPATGPMVRVFAASAPFDRSVLFHQAECRVLHFSLESTGWRINRVQQLDVSLDVDCQLPSGETLVGNASAPGCL
jgi:hypothetical protein